MSLMSAKSNTTNEECVSDACAESAPSDVMAGRIPAKMLKKKLLHHDDHEHTVSPANHPPGRISRTLVNFWLDGLLGLVFVKLCIVAVIVQFVFPPGIAARGASLWGMNYGQWCSVQFAVLSFLGLGILLHVMLHWTWVCSVLTKRVLGLREIPDDGIRTIYGVGLLICLLLLGATSIGVAQWMIVLPK